MDRHQFSGGGPRFRFYLRETGGAFGFQAADCSQQAFVIALIKIGQAEDFANLGAACGRADFVRIVEI